MRPSIPYSYLRTDFRLPVQNGSLACSKIEVSGSTKPCLLLLHGLLSTRREVPVRSRRIGMFEALGGLLASQGISSVAFDFRGCGESTGLPLGGCSPSSMLHDTISVALSPTLALTSNHGLVIAGWCQGAVTAANVAQLMPSVVSGISLLNPFRRYRHTLEFIHGKSVIEDALNRMSTEFVEIRTISGRSRRIVAGHFQQMVAMNDLDFLRHIKVPVQIIQATKDKILPDQGPLHDLADSKNDSFVSIPTDHAFGSFEEDDDLLRLSAEIASFISHLP